MRDVILALDPGQTTGWVLYRRADREILGVGDLPSEDVGSGIDVMVRTMHIAGYSLEAVVEEMPTTGGVNSDLANELEFVRRTIDHWLDDVYELPVRYILPGTWKNSRTARTVKAPRAWNGVKLSPHMRDAYVMARYHARRGA